MSLESLNALKTLVEQRSQTASIQNDNLDNVQKAVQQTGTGEAQRVDKVNLEAVKAVYETQLIKARVDHLAAKLAREEKAVALNGLILGVTAGLSAASNIQNLVTDLSGGSKLGDSDAKNGGKLKGGAEDYDKSRIEKKGSAGNIDYDTAKSSTAHQYDTGLLKQDGNAELKKSGVLNESGAVNIDKAKKEGFLDDKGAVTDKGTNAGFSKDGLSVESRTVLGKDGQINVKEAQRQGFLDDKGGITAAGEKFGFDKDSKGALSIREGDKSQVVARTETNGDGSTQSIQISSVRQSDINKALQEKGFTKDGQLTDKGKEAGLSQDSSGISFNGKKLDNFQNLVEFDKSGKGGGVSDVAFSYNKRAIEKSEVGTYLSITDKADKTGKATDAAKDHLKQEGKYQSTLSKIGDGANATANAVVSFAQDVAPFFEAYQKAKDKRDETAIELDAEVRKLAAAFKRLKALKAAIVNPGEGGDGSAAGQAEGGK